MRRREFIMRLGGAATIWPLAAHAQQLVKVPRIGFLVTAPFDTPEFRQARDPFLQGMRELGYIEGQNFRVEYRSAEGKQERFASLAVDLVGMNVDLIVAAGTPHARAAQLATRTIPIIVPAMSNPVADGLVASLARPGGNITGLTTLGAELAPKLLDILSQALPGLSRVAVLWHPGAFSDHTANETWKATEAAAARLRLQLRRVDVRSADDIDGAFDTIARERPEALILVQSTMFFTERRRIADLVARWMSGGLARRAIFNLKLPMKKRYDEVRLCEQHIAAAMRDTPFTLALRQLYHGREEVTGYLSVATR